MIGLMMFAFLIMECIMPDADQEYGTIRMAGYVKAAITFVKYTPQVYLNWKRKSTVGWSIINVWLDFWGGFLSFIQMACESIFIGEPLFADEVHGFNIVKFLLSAFAMGFDVIFLV